MISLDFDATNTDSLDPSNPATPALRWIIKARELVDQALLVDAALTRAFNAILADENPYPTVREYWNAYGDALNRAKDESAAWDAAQESLALFEALSLSSVARSVVKPHLDLGWGQMRLLHGGFVAGVIAHALEDESGTRARNLLRRVLDIRAAGPVHDERRRNASALAYDEHSLLALWNFYSAKMATPAGFEKLQNSARGYFAQGLKWMAAALAKKDKPLTRGLTAIGGDKNERNEAAARAASLDDPLADVMSTALSALDQIERSDRLERLIAVLLDRSSPDQRKLVERLEGGQDPAEALRDLGRAEGDFRLLNSLRGKAGRVREEFDAQSDVSGTQKNPLGRME